MAAEGSKWVLLEGEDWENKEFTPYHWPVNEPAGAIEKGCEFEGARTLACLQPRNSCISFSRKKPTLCKIFERCFALCSTRIRY